MKFSKDKGMETIRAHILNYLDEFQNDKKLINDLNQLIAATDEKTCQVIIHVLTHLNLEIDEARNCWRDIVSHWQEMCNSLGREVSLRTAICDYFCSIHISLRNPKVVEIHIFEKAVNDSRYDRLTNLFNRSTFEELFAKEIAKAKRYGKDLSFLFFDLDNFKSINDTYGHPVGDEVLQQVAQLILKERRIEDIAARFGGEEIVVILPETVRVDALVLAERIREKVEALKFSCEGEELHVTISGGIASFPLNATDAKGLIKCADNALYQAKGAGKNRICLYSSSERRRYLRIDFDQDIKIKELVSIDRQLITARSKDISIGGILFENKCPLPIGAKVQLTLTINSHAPLIIIGNVVRVESYGPQQFDIGVSISLLDMDKTIRDEVSRYLMKQLQGQIE